MIIENYEMKVHNIVDRILRWNRKPLPKKLTLARIHDRPFPCQTEEQLPLARIHDRTSSCQTKEQRRL
jgi:hypothetical protein